MTKENYLYNMNAKENYLDHMNTEEFVKGFKRISDMVRMENPDYIFAPVVGAVPFIDILHIVDRHFPIDSVTYLPNSSRFENRDELMDRWYHNFYKENETGDKIKIVCLDEVLSGSSAVKGYKQFRKSLDDRSKEKAKGLNNEVEVIQNYRRKLEKNISYKIIGIQEKGKILSPSFRKLLNSKLVHLVSFDNVPTIDNVSLNPIRLKVKGKNIQGRTNYLAEIDSFDITPDYLNFLREIACYAGYDPSNISPINLSKIDQDIRKSII
jgi:hypothetical protein